MRARLAGLLLAGLIAGCGPDVHQQEHDARTAVFERLSLPDQPVVVGPAVVASNFAVVDWTRGGFAGGRTLLRRDKSGWALMLCGGQPLRRRPVVERAGVPDGAAGVLITKLLREESRIDPSRRAQLDQWKPLPASVTCPEPKG